ncbi:MAG: response regulator [Nigerium sp.]|nr:response regulator [Nigerium sp.]
MSEPLTVALCDDSGIFRQGVAMLLEASGIVVTASTGSGPELQAVLRKGLPDAVLLDMRMPPTHTDEGIAVAAELRREHPGLGILVFSGARTTRLPVTAQRRSWGDQTHPRLEGLLAVPRRS